MNDRLTFKVYNKPYNTFIQLKEKTLANHIINEHSGRSFLLIEDNVKQIAEKLEQIDTVVKDAKHDSRKNYYSTAFLVNDNSINDNSCDVKLLKIVTEPIDDNLEDIVTIYPIRKESSINKSNIVRTEWKDDGI